jgi:hypothetical protein
MKMKETWVKVRSLIDAGLLCQATELLISMGWERQKAWEQVRSVKKRRYWETAQAQESLQSRLL